MFLELYRIIFAQRHIIKGDLLLAEAIPDWTGTAPRYWKQVSFSMGKGHESQRRLN